MRIVVKVCRTIVLLLTAALLGGSFWLIKKNQGHPPPRYYAAITNASLVPGRPDGMTSASFDLSLGVAAPPSRRDFTGSWYCLEGGTAVEVSFRGVLLARAVVADWEAVCANWWLRPGNTRWTSIVALGENITTLPGFVADALAADARTGVREFDVSIWMADGKTTAWCGAMKVGDEDKTADTCDVHYHEPTLV